jgi:uncharacterized protein YndB with AHSA1/START domain
MTDTSFQTTTTVQAPVDRAFKVFTEGFDTWWPRGHHIGAVDMAEAVLEQHQDGRWYERGVDGSECDWGRVLTWDPPQHIAVSWHLNGEWKYDPDPEKASRIDVRFTALDDSTTRVDLVHSGLDRHGESWLQVRDGISQEGGWPGLLVMFAEAAR